VFVAKSRDVQRTAVTPALVAGVPIAVYGSGWDGVAGPGVTVHDYVPNAELPLVYASAGVLLNDHWDSMRDHGFVSNRCFDALACGTPVISDHLPEISELFGDAVMTYETAEELRALVERTRDDPTAARARADRGRRAVLAAHTIDHRARSLLTLLDQYGLAHARSGASPVAQEAL
jgi:spore maturation protein CgeB